MAELTITGTHTSNAINGASVMPFTGVTITDPTPGATDSLKITYFGGGQISGVARSGATTSDSNGGYIITGTAAQVTQELDSIVYTPDEPPPGGSQIIEFDLTDFSSATNYNYGDGGFSADYGTKVVSSTQPDTVSLSSQVAYHNGVFTLAGHASSVVGVTSVDIQAIVDGVPTDLGSTTVDANGNFTFADRIGAHTQGFITARAIDSTNTYPARDTAPFSLTGGLRQGAYRAEQDSYTDDGSTEASTSLFRAGGSRLVDVQASGQAFESDYFDTFQNHGAPDNTFVFDPGHGQDVVSLFRVNGSDHDTLSFQGSDFGNSIADVLQNTRNTEGGAVINDPTTGDTVKLAGITKAELTKNQSDIAFHA